MRARPPLVTALAVTAVLATAVPATATVISTTTTSVSDVPVRRLAGVDRYATAAAIARATPSVGRTVTIARGDAFPDALAAVNLEGPVLLTPFAGLPASTAQVLRDARPPSAYVLGSTSVVSTRAEGQVRELVPDVHRRGGRDRYATAAASMYSSYTFEGRFPRSVDGLPTALLASGEDFADAMSAGPLSYAEDLPLLLTARDSLPPATRDALEYNQGSAVEVQQVVLLGGRGAVSDRVVEQVEALGIEVRRVYGPDRQATALALLEFAESELGWSLDHVNLARGDAFADAVAGGPHAGAEKAPVLLTAGVDELGAATRAFLRARGREITSIDVLGDSTAVSEAVVEDVQRALSGG